MKKAFLALFAATVFLHCLESHAQLNGHPYVDLGLPSGNLWATCNIGASSPTDYGDYYAWGELAPKYYYTWDSYKYYNRNQGFTKYNDADALEILEPEDDAAHILWGGNWQIPNEMDWMELLKHVHIYTVHRNGITYFSLESKHNYGKLILPLNGFKTDDSRVKLRGEAFCLWLCTNMERMYYFFGQKAEEGNAYAAISRNTSDNKFTDFPLEAARCNGLGIRPVYCKQKKLSRAQKEAIALREKEEQLRKEQEKRENEVVLALMTDYPPVFQNKEKYSDTMAAFMAYLKDKIGRNIEYDFSANVYIGKDGRVYDATIKKLVKGPDNIESLFKKAALDSPAWTPAREPRKGEFAVKSEIIFRLRNP